MLLIVSRTEERLEIVRGREGIVGLADPCHEQHVGTVVGNSREKPEPLSFDKKGGKPVCEVSSTGGSFVVMRLLTALYSKE